MRFAISVDINATPEEVWYWLGDPERAKTWMTSVTHTEYIHRTPEMIGSTLRETVEENGRGTELQGVITAFTPNEKMAVSLEGDYNTADVTFTLEEQDGFTRLTQTADVRFKGITRLLSLLFGRTFRKNITQQAQSEFATLKTLCESGAAGG